MNTKYDVELPKTREESMAESSFEWVKTERAGDLSRYREIVIDNGVEYIVFQDGTRVNSSLIGDVILQHQNSFEILGNIQDAFENIKVADLNSNSTLVVDPNWVPSRIPSISTTETLVYNKSSVPSQEPTILPSIAILEKAKKKKKKFNLEVNIELPSAEVISIVRENFDASDEQLFDYFITKIDKKKFISSIISSISNK
jgi:hypothetical protein